MLKRKSLFLYTFIGILIVIFSMGLIGVSLSMHYMQEKYIQLQVDLNKRRTNTFARMLSRELEQGSSHQAILNRFQSSIEVTDPTKGFLCIFNSTEGRMLCHPNPRMVGMKMNPSLLLENNRTKEITAFSEAIKNRATLGGILNNKNQTEITYMRPVANTNWVISAHENIEGIQKEIKRQRIVFGSGFLFFATIIAFLTAWVARKVSSSYERHIENQNELLDNNLKELQILHTDLQGAKLKTEKQRDQIALQHKDITDSVQYASRIQQAVLPPDELIQLLFPNHFVFFKPRDIISGDFYWINENGRFKAIAVGDCTGHGVPGGLMSLLAISFLNNITLNQQQWDAAEILDILRLDIIRSLHQDRESGNEQDGLDVALCIIDKETNTLQFAGAYHPLWLFRKDQLLFYPGDRMPIGIYQSMERGFKNTTIQLQDDDLVYLFSDGYVDQFGGPDDKKFLKKRFEGLISSIASEALPHQKEILSVTLNNWRQCHSQKDCRYDQTDDILIVAVKF